MFLVSRRELLGRTVLGVQILLLAACGGDDDNDDAEATARRADGSAGLCAKACQRTGHAEARLGSRSVCRRSRKVHRAVERGRGARRAGRRTMLERMGGPSPSVAPSRNILVFVESAQAATRIFLTEQESAGTPPDLFLFNRFFDFPWVFRSGLVQPLDRHLQQDQTEPLENFLPSALELVRYQSQTMALPVALDVGVARYNPTQFTDAGIPLPDRGWTREDFVAAAQRLTEDKNSDGEVDAWGFRPVDLFANWLPFVLQELGEDVINLDTGAVRFTDPAALRGLQFWEELGRVHKVMPHGASVTADQFSATSRPCFRHSLLGLLSPTYNLPGQQAPLPTAPQDVTPLMLSGALAIPSVATDADLSYEALRPLALNLGERLLLPPVTAGQEFIENPSSDNLELALPEHERQLVLHLLDAARPSLLATSFIMTNQLFQSMVLPLARGEMDVGQAAQEAQNWLQSYLNE